MASCSEQFLKVSWNSVHRSKRSPEFLWSKEREITSMWCITEWIGGMCSKLYMLREHQLQPRVIMARSRKRCSLLFLVKSVLKNYTMDVMSKWNQITSLWGLSKGRILSLHREDFSGCYWESRSEIVYKEGVEMYIADTLSRAYLPASIDVEKATIFYIDQRSYLSISEGKIWKIKVKEASKEDETMNLLKQVIKSGWPDCKWTSAQFSMLL